LSLALLEDALGIAVDLIVPLHVKGERRQRILDVGQRDSVFGREAASDGGRTLIRGVAKHDAEQTARSPTRLEFSSGPVLGVVNAQIPHVGEPVGLLGHVTGREEVLEKVVRVGVVGEGIPQRVALAALPRVFEGPVDRGVVPDVELGETQQAEVVRIAQQLRIHRDGVADPAPDVAGRDPRGALLGGVDHVVGEGHVVGVGDELAVVGGAVAPLAQGGELRDGLGLTPGFVRAIALELGQHQAHGAAGEPLVLRADEGRGGERRPQNRPCGECDQDPIQTQRVAGTPGGR
jgi:hypothetical protein